jgi:hypothetical protein
MFITFIVVMVTQGYIYIQIYQIVYINYVQLLYTVVPQ